MSESTLITKCYICQNESQFLLPCQFCEQMVCSKHAHYLPTKEETVNGIRNDVVRVCPNCMPSRRLF